MLDFLDDKDFVGVILLVQRQFASLAESSLAALKVTLKRLLLSVDVHMLLQVLGQCECLETDQAHVLLDCRVRCYMSPKREPSSVGFGASLDLTSVWSFHLKL